MQEFLEAKDRLLGIAYGITGDLGAAEDIVQDAWLRLNRTQDIEDVTGWLVVTTSRLALDYVRSARVRREQYVGPWLPEPLVEGPEDRVTMTESVNLAMLVVLETLSPAERTAFVLHEVFGMPFAEVAEAVGRSAAAVRQLTSRARKHVRDRTPRFDLDHAQQKRVVDAFSQACVGGDIEGLLRLLDPEVVLKTDGGGVMKAARKPVYGADKVSRFLAGVHRAPVQFRAVQVNGWAGLLRFVDGDLHSVVALTTANGRVTAIDMVANPEKLTRVRALINGEEE
ncbi:RNA polymerase sigma factor SigJ [Kibdelosporangium aridum]|uniref:RNA polymerase sigma-70 factor, ECF subfamily n=1 Tax=Kibdelosporangium aridum TaxID=2030 RepID=A0A1W2ARH6_KIBAR|nr:RNA polymerase sigma factor SigJ [Kibdelosporangium aridum]SMC63317.1 RNA polymerase sigma-70 factor, ECF subfamily [Kibdelosporangium aridum]